MKKFVLCMFVILCLVLSGTAFAAAGGEGNNTGCNGVGNPNSPCGETGGGGGGGGEPPVYEGDFSASFDVEARASGSGQDFDLEFSWGKGITQGLALAEGEGFAGADGSTENGIAFGDVTATGGGLADVTTFTDTIPNTDYSFVIGTESNAFSTFGGTVDIGVSGPGGEASGYVQGGGSQLTEATSAVGRGDNKSFGATGQRSDSGFMDSVSIESRDRAFIGGEGEMSGFSYSNSYNYVNGGTIGYGTNVGSGTEINASTGFTASGVAITETTQSNLSGNASSSAKGSYGGYATGGDFTGGSVGYTNTSLTTAQGMNGTISRSAAGMTSTANFSGGQVQSR